MSPESCCARAAGDEAPPSKGSRWCEDGDDHRAHVRVRVRAHVRVRVRARVRARVRVRVRAQTNRALVVAQTNQPLLALELSPEMLDRIAPRTRGVAKHDRTFADQLRRAAQGVTLNLAESAGHHGGNRRLRYESALGRRRGRDSVTARDEGRALRRHVGSADDGGPTSRRLPDSRRPSGRRSR